ncbi:extracellular solute-binding protein [Phytoactinopolyspora alkaliphila]|uniref:Extracellular solute-binding protein n=1 Tax=Phytoactinopolyspora alkaliphila TaxID=1783498 RepID=A0A6N9YFH7_9ACTN|nr:extracellular solute-binding protein [Phytoactinopolyspora alkaliphila]NED93712.1 extracellular solute-binding protein [Phytoactinopolyspora alkaliphila]
MINKGVVTVSLAGAVMVMTACSGGGGDDIVISYNTPDEWANWGAVLEEFTSATGIAAPNDPKNSGQTLAALESEAAAPAADVAYYGIVFGMEAQAKGLVAPFESDALSEIPDDLKADDGSWFTVHQGAIAFLVNTDAIGDAPVPQCWEDLTDPAYANMVGFLDPASAAVGYSVMAAVNYALGGDENSWDPGITWASTMRQQGLALPTQTATSAVQQGEIPILIDADFNGYKLANIDDAPVEVVLPCEGTLAVPYVMSLVDGGPNEENGRELLEFVLSDEAQQLFAEYYLRPVRDVEVPADVAEAMVPAEEYEERVQARDFNALNSAMDDFLGRWSAEVMG